MPIVHHEQLQDAFKYKDDFGSEIYGEEDSDSGFMITVDIRTYGDMEGTCHLPKEEAIILAKFILETIG